MHFKETFEISSLNFELIKRALIIYNDKKT